MEVHERWRHPPQEEPRPPPQRSLSGPWIQKPLPSGEVGQEEVFQLPTSGSPYQAISVAETLPTMSSSLDRHLSLWDLVSVGIGGTVGSGLFVLCGFVAHEFAGPAAALSWAISGVAACLSGCCYAEMAGRIPTLGSAYAYVYVSMGELPAVLAAACLALDYVVASAAVARSFGDKVVHYLTEELHEGHWVHQYLQPNELSFNPLAGLVAAACVTLLANGVRESKAVTNVFTILKVTLVAFMVVTAFCYVKPYDWTPFLPSQFGMAGVLRGATGSFFGYLGYDEMCCLAGEANNPKRDIPIAILITLGSVSILYVVATVALTGMENFTEISSVSGFPAGFRSNGAYFAAQLSALGEVVTLPIVVLITVMVQPRLQYAMAKDGLLPPVLAELDDKGNMTKGIIISGFIMIVIASFVPFEHLNDTISAAVLMALSMTDTSLVLLWHEAPHRRPMLTEQLMLVFHVTALVSSIIVTHFHGTIFGKLIPALGVCVMLGCVWCIHLWCPKSSIFGGMQRSRIDVITSEIGYFRTPFVPYLPCLGVVVNYYLIAQLELIGIAMFIGWLGAAAVFYFCYGAHHSVGNTVGWDGAPVDEQGTAAQSRPLTTRVISLPTLSER